MTFDSIKINIDCAKFHHYGIGLRAIKDFNIKLDSLKIYDPIQKVNVAFFYINETLIELIEPAEINSPVSNSIKNNKSYNHICYETSSFDKTLNSLKSQKFTQISKPVFAEAFKKKIIWFKNLHLGLLEIISDE